MKSKKGKAIRHFDANDYAGVLSELGDDVEGDIEAAGSGGGAIIFIRPIYGKKGRKMKTCTLFFEKNDRTILKSIKREMAEQHNWETWDIWR